MSDASQKSEFELVEPRLVSIRFRGVVDLDEAKRVMDFIETHVKNEPFFLFEAVMTGMTGATPEGRGHAADRLRTLPERAIAIVGGSFMQRTLGKLVLTASMMLDKSGRRNAGSVFADESEARAWLREYAQSRH
jgi:hypothetical protein